MILGILTIKRLAIGSKLHSWTNFARPYLKHLLAYVLLLSSIRNERRALSKLTDDALVDIGKCQRDALLESKKSFWDVPEDRQSDFDETVRQGAKPDTTAVRR